MMLIVLATLGVWYITKSTVCLLAPESVYVTWGPSGMTVFWVAIVKTRHLALELLSKEIMVAEFA